MNSSRIPKIDPHIDIPDLYKELGLTKEDFLSDKDIAVSLKKLHQNNIKIVGATLYFDSSFVQTSFYDGVNSFYNWYQELLKLTQAIYPITSLKQIQDTENKIALFYSIEGFECLRTPTDFAHFYDLGVRSFGLTWSGDNNYACGRSTKNDTGISRIGVEVIKQMNDKPLLVDIAHLSEQSVIDLAKNYSGMIVCTHSNLRSVYKSNHNLKDEEVDIIVQRGGVASLFPLSEDTGKHGTFDEFYRHVCYFIDKWGIDYLAISSDIYPMDIYPFLEGHKDIGILNALEDYLLTKMSRANVQKIFYDNWLRILKAL